MRLTRLLSVGGIALLANGCAADRVVKPAQTIHSSTTVFLTQLTAFQTTLQALQSAKQDWITANTSGGEQAVAATRRLQIMQDVSESGSPEKVFYTLQAAAQADVSAMTAAPAAVPAAAPMSLPIDQVGSTAKAVGDLAKAPGNKADIQFLTDFTKSVNKDLGAPKSATPAAAK
jgi:hypothetical protein